MKKILIALGLVVLLAIYHVEALVIAKGIGYFAVVLAVTCVTMPLLGFSVIAIIIGTIGTIVSTYNNIVFDLTNKSCEQIWKEIEEKRGESELEAWMREDD